VPQLEYNNLRGKIDHKLQAFYDDAKIIQKNKNEPLPKKEAK
jgi:hypothetical protein